MAINIIKTIQIIFYKILNIDRFICRFSENSADVKKNIEILKHGNGNNKNISNMNIKANNNKLEISKKETIFKIIRTGRIIAVYHSPYCLTWLGHF